MSGDQIAKFWTIVSPATWPELPRSMSFSTLIELEACPRRWALKRADYVGVLDTRGYPDPPSLPTIEGTVVHLSLQIVASALVESGCPSLSHETAIATLRRLGGFTVVVQSSLERALKSYDRNPRAVPILDRVRERLNDRVPELRAKVQKQVARVQPVSRAGVGTSAVSRSLGRSRRRLLRGSYSEVRLQAPEISWHGIADLAAVLPITSLQSRIGGAKYATSRRGSLLKITRCNFGSMRYCGREMGSLTPQRSRQPDLWSRMTTLIWRFQRLVRNSIGTYRRTLRGGPSERSLIWGASRRKHVPVQTIARAAPCGSFAGSIGSGADAKTQCTNRQVPSLAMLRSDSLVGMGRGAGMEWWSQVMGWESVGPSCYELGTLRLTCMRGKDYVC